MKLTLAAAILLSLAGLAFAQAAPAAESDQGAVLDLDAGSFRTFIGYQTPVMLDDNNKLTPLLDPAGRGQKEEDSKPAPVVKLAIPSETWPAADFDDSRWPRARGPVVVREWFNGTIYTPGNPSEVRRVCVRGRFLVEDPAKVGQLILTMEYYGGVVIYVNGVELARHHIPAGELTDETLAEAYPPEAYVRPDGKRYSEGDERDKELVARMAVRLRRLPNGQLVIPASALRKGVNVLAIKSLSPPARTLLVDAPLATKTWRGEPTPWPHAGLLAVRLTAESGAALGSPAASTKIGLTVNQPIENASTWDIAMPQDRIPPVRIVGARNGAFSGQVALSSSQAIRNIKASIGPLASANGAGIDPADIRIRYAEPGNPQTSRNSPMMFERLLDEFPAEVKPARVEIRGRKVQPTPAAVVPIWVTVQVPAKAVAGEYTGVLRVSAEGGADGKQPATFEVPVALKVNDWTLPGPAEFTVRHNLFQSPESVALWHKVELWSDKHFEVVGKSLKSLGEIGNGICVLPLVVNACNLGNRESMVRWVKQADGTFKHDYTVLDRYLATYQTSSPPPWIVALYVWAHYDEKNIDKVVPLSVTMVDTDGSRSAMPQPTYGSKENEEFWRPVLAEVRKRLEKIGWFDRTAVIITSYCHAPSKAVIETYRSIWSDGKWMNSSHSNPTVWGGMPVPYSQWVWGCGRPYDPDRQPERKFPSPWTAGSKRIELANPRVGTAIISRLGDTSPLAAFRYISEGTYQAEVRGIGHVGGDFWPVPIGPRGQHIVMANSQYAVGMPNSTTAFNAPCERSGVVATTRYEMFREGIQAAEAIVALQRAIIEKKVDEAMAGRINSLLDERARHYLRTRPGQEANWMSMESSNWQQRDDELFSLAGEVAGK